MINILSMDHFQQLARAKFTDWYNAKNAPETITPGDTFIVWSCKALQNYKTLVSTNAKSHIFTPNTLTTETIRKFMRMCTRS